MQLTDCLDNEIYYWESSEFKYINWYKKPNNNSNANIKCYISITSEIFEPKSGMNNYLTNIRIATPEEKHWLLCCMKANKYISLEDALLSFIPVKKSNLEEIKDLELIYKRLLNII